MKIVKILILSCLLWLFLLFLGHWIKMGYRYFNDGCIMDYCFVSFSKKEVKAAVERVIAKHPYLRDTTKFQENKDTNLDGFYSCTIKDNRGQLYVLDYQYTDTSRIALHSAAKHGEIRLFPKDIGFKERRIYRELFEEHFISKLKKELNCSDCGMSSDFGLCE
jgi:hypothetical protein